MNFGKNRNIFPKKGRGGSKAVWNFSKNSSIMERTGVPYKEKDIIMSVHQIPDAQKEECLEELLARRWRIMSIMVSQGGGGQTPEVSGTDFTGFLHLLTESLSVFIFSN